MVVIFLLLDIASVTEASCEKDCWSRRDVGWWEFYCCACELKDSWGEGGRSAVLSGEHVKEFEGCNGPEEIDSEGLVAAG